MSDCIFCNIVAGKSPCYKVYEDENFLGFLDIFPRTKGHTVLIPKKHFRWVYDVPNFSDYWQAVLKVTKAIQTGLNPSFVAYITHGLDVEHAHIHIMPRYDDETEYVPEIKKISAEELKTLAQKINSAF